MAPKKRKVLPEDDAVTASASSSATTPGGEKEKGQPTKKDAVTASATTPGGEKEKDQSTKKDAKEDKKPFTIRGDDAYVTAAKNTPSDFTLVVQGFEFKVHRSILCTETTLLDDVPKTVDRLFIRGYSPQVVAVMLDAVYKLFIPYGSFADKATAVAKIASEYECERLTAAIVDWMPYADRFPRQIEKLAFASEYRLPAECIHRLCEAVVDDIQQGKNLSVEIGLLPEYGRATLCKYLYASLVKCYAKPDDG
jgi:hypothetical protein